MALPQGFLARLPICKPTMIVDEKRARHNIKRMAAKAKASGVRLRAHAKTHQSTQVGQWFRDYGVEAITVSSVDMATGFADAGWDDITVAIPVNIRQIEEIDALAARIRLGIVVDSHAAVEALANGLEHEVDVWIKVDIGYGRAGILWEHKEKISELAAEIESVEMLNFRGILTHSGHSYKAGSLDGVRAIYKQTVERMNVVKQAVLAGGVPKCEISVGDTPCCVTADRFEGVDEIRPGNFVYFDLMQWDAGICSGEEIAAAVACPVVGIYSERGQVVIYGGGVHFSKDSIKGEDGKPVFGYLVQPDENGWGDPRKDAPLVSLSQEHGTLNLPPELLTKTEIGDLALIVPVHSCLAADLLTESFTTDGARLDRISATAR